jgi:hypothetical protein
MPIDRIYYYWFNQGLRTQDDLEMIKISIGITKFIIEFGNRDTSIKRTYHNKEIVTRIREHFKKNPLIGTSPYEEIKMLDGCREYMVYNGTKIYQTYPENPLLEFFKLMINTTLDQDFENLAFSTFKLLSEKNHRIY